MSLDVKEIKKLQENLSSIRKIAGWTAQELGQKIGVTKQTISNLENQKTDMTLTQYIAIRSILDYEIQHNKDNELLPQAVYLLLDSEEDITDEATRNKNIQTITTIAAALAGGATAASLLPISAGLIGGIIGATSAIPWMKKIWK